MVMLDDVEGKGSTCTICSHVWTIDFINDVFPTPRMSLVSVCMHASPLIARLTMCPRKHYPQLAYVFPTFRKSPPAGHTDARHH